MKIIAVDNCFSVEPEKMPLFSGISDTALLTKNKPFFIPDFAQPCLAKPYFVVQICRLGRSISARFAHRYYDRITTGVLFTAQNLWEEALATHRPCDYARSFDGAAVIGSLLPMSEAMQDYTLTLQRSAHEIWQGRVGEMQFTIDDLIAHISRYQLLRQGDLLFMGSPTPAFEVHIDDHLDGFLNGESVFSFNIK